MTKRRPWGRIARKQNKELDEKLNREAALEEGFNQQARAFKEERSITLYRARLLTADYLLADPELKPGDKEWLEHKKAMIEFDHKNKNEPKGDTVDQLLSSLYPTKE